MKEETPKNKVRRLTLAVKSAQLGVIECGRGFASGAIRFGLLKSALETLGSAEESRRAAGIPTPGAAPGFGDPVTGRSGSIVRTGLYLEAGILVPTGSGHLMCAKHENGSFIIWPFEDLI